MLRAGLLVLFFVLLPDEKIISKIFINTVEFVRKHFDRGIDLNEAQFFSRNKDIHPLPKILLKDPLYSPLFFSKIQDNLYEKRNFINAFYIISKLSSDIKRIDLLGNPAKFDKIPSFNSALSKYPDTLSALYNFAYCVSEAVKKIDRFVKDNPKFLIKTPQNLTYISDIVIRNKITQYEIDSFLKEINTAFYLTLYCSSEILKRKEIFYKVPGLSTEILGVEIAIYGQENDFVLVPEIPAIIINLGGNDTYFEKKWSDRVFPSALFIFDFGGGKDRYHFSDPRPLSLTFIHDDGGDDIYECNIGCFGGALFSADMLVDIGGNDKYTATGLSQGAGIIGTGVLMDLGGNDIYEATAFSQGFGGNGGGILIDYEGNDKYILRKGNDFPSYQDKNHNLSMGQGCGTGIRADYIEDFDSIPGGVGILFDFSGDDEYSAEVFSQGCGYWYGVGVLGDTGGNDKYSGYWYCLGSSAHFGVGVFYDYSGDDEYSCEFQAMGHGHDFGAGVFLDYGENDSDRFSCNTRCLGSAHANGVSLFINQGGDDIYKAEKVAFGDALVDLYERKKHSTRQIMPTHGFFIDIGGRDRFFMAGKEITEDEVKSYWYSNQDMKKYIEEKYIIRQFLKF